MLMYIMEFIGVFLGDVNAFNSGYVVDLILFIFSIFLF